MILPSGKEIKITLADFAVGNALKKAFLEELKSIKMDEFDFNFKKDLLCTVLSSEKIEACLWKCMERATYDGRKIDKDTFEPAEARGDFTLACLEVASVNLLPFGNDLSGGFSLLLGALKKDPA